MANKPLKSIKYPGLSDTYTFTQVDPTFTEPGQAPDAKETGDRFDQNEANITDLLSNEYKAYATDTATGTVASFEDGADNIPMKDVTVQIEPVQDLHGYDNPWPAGGGKNLVPPSVFTSTYTSNGITFTATENGIVTATGTATGRADYNTTRFTLKAGTYVINGSTSGSSSSYWVQLMEYGVGLIASSNDGDSASFTISEDKTVTFALRIAANYTCSSGGVIFKPMIRLASITDDTFAPYSNICPITGWTGVNVQRTGKNLLNPDAIMIGTYGPSGDTSLNNNTGYRRFKLTLPKGNYVFSTDLEDCYVIRVFINNVLVKSSLTAQSYSFTLSETSEIKIAFRNTSSTNITQPFNCMIELGSSATDYEPYTGNLYPITFPTEAGTVYGGTLDVTTGELVVDRAEIASYNGETLPSTWISDRDAYSAGATPTTEAQVVYKLAAPITYQLTPTEIRSLLGINNLWADTGDSTVEYRADTSLYISKKITEAVSALS